MSMCALQNFARQAAIGGLKIIKNCIYSGGDLWALQPWKHLVKRLDSLFLSVKNNLRGRSGCLMRIC